MRVRIRKELQSYLVYFLDCNRLVVVNKLGAFIAHALFNENASIVDIAHRIAIQFQVDQERTLHDVRMFVGNIQEELELDGYQTIEQEQHAVPTGVELQINTDCNLRCAHCFQENYSAENVMSYTRASEIIATLSCSGVFELSIIGGEPFRHPDIMAILAHAQACLLSTTITTNGILVTDDIIRTLSTMKWLSVFVSLDGIGNVHDTIRGKGTFAQTDRVIRSLVSAGVPVDVLCTLNAYNAPYFCEIIDYCQEIGIPCDFNLFKPFKESHRLLTLPPNDFFAIVVELTRLKENGVSVGVGNAAISSELMGLAPRNECTASLAGLVIDSQGKMVTCPGLVTSGFYTADELPDFDEDWVHTWLTHPTFTSFRERGLSGCQVRSHLLCNDCTIPDPYGIDAFRVYYTKRLPH